MATVDQEWNALLTLLCSFDHEDMKEFLGTNGLPRIGDFSAPEKRLPAIVIDFIAWLKLHPDKRVVVFTALSTDFAATDEAPILAAAAARIAVIDARQQDGPAHETRLASGIPIVNRAVLRGYLGEAVNDAGNPTSDIKVVAITGDRGLGRTHSWYLIKFVADSGAAKAIKIDLISATLENQTLDILFKQLIRELRITDAEYPSADGVTSDTLAARYAEELASCINRAADAWLKPMWIVFDSLDRDIRPEIKRFISLLSRARLDATFGKCVLFLLGPDTICQPDDPTRILLSEPLVTFTDAEIIDAASCLNRLGSATLTASVLEERTAAMTALRGTVAPGEFSRQIAARLVDLRIEVRA